MNKLTFFAVIVLLAMLVFGCHEETVNTRRDAFNGDYLAHTKPENFVTVISNPMLPLLPGSTFVYSSETSHGTERSEIKVLQQTRVVMGIVCTLVWDKVYLNDQLIEETYDYFAQDKDGNVWYMGEQVDNYINGILSNHYGSWEAGVDGAEPGIMMLNKPEPGLYYRQEHYIGSAEDQAEVIGKNLTITVAAGTFQGCIKIEETNPLDASFLEYKYYAPNVGLVKIEKIADPVELEELKSYTIN